MEEQIEFSKKVDYENYFYGIINDVDKHLHKNSINAFYKGTERQCKIIKCPNLSGTNSLAYSLRDVSRSNFVRLKHWDVSNIIDFTGCFEGNVSVNSRMIKHWDVSNGLYFRDMFRDSCDCDDEFHNGFKYLRNWDCSKGLIYDGMFNIKPDSFGYEAMNYEAISHIKVNPKGSFTSCFWTLSKEDAEHFRNWFPDMDIRDIILKVT